MTFQVRPFDSASADDHAALVRMGEEVVESGRAFVFEDVQGVLDYWLDGEGQSFVATDDRGAVVGTYIVKPNYAGRGSHIANAGYMVAAGARGRGIGLLLGEHSIETARRLGYHGLQFNMVVATNAHALRLWEKLGMRVVGTVPGAFRRPDGGFDDAFVLFRELGEDA